MWVVQTPHGTNRGLINTKISNSNLYTLLSVGALWFFRWTLKNKAILLLFLLYWLEVSQSGMLDLKCLFFFFLSLSTKIMSESVWEVGGGIYRMLFVIRKFSFFFVDSLFRWFLRNLHLSEVWENEKFMPPQVG